jgi:carboxyl-terminal processing protease
MGHRMLGVLGAGLLFALLGCVNPATETPLEGRERLVLETAFKNIDLRYAEAVTIRSISIAGMSALSKTDTLLDITEQPTRVALRYDRRVLGEWDAPEENDHEAWAAIVANALHRARREAPKLDDEDPERVLAKFFNGGFAKLDRYTRYETPQQARNTRARREGFGGLGVTIRYDKGETYVQKVHEETPAFRAALKAGDHITHVGDTPLSGLSQRAAVTHLRGPVHSRANLTIAREGSATPLKIGVVRAHIILPTVTSERDKGILTIKITGFNQGTSRSLGKVLVTAERDGHDNLRGIVLDLRGNPGGLLDQAVAVADFFLNDGLIISTKGRHSRANQTFNASWGEQVEKTPIAILINGRSASASEIVAAALRDRGRAIVVGASSFGKGSVQTIIRLPNGGELTLTWAHMIAPAGFNLHGHGVIPAICTSATERPVADMVEAIRADSPAAGAALGRALSSRHAIRTNPALAREQCPPTGKRPKEDREIARYLLEHKSLYNRALKDGGAAIAQR